MVRHRISLALVLGLLAASVPFAVDGRGQDSRQDKVGNKKRAEVQKVLDNYEAARPNATELAIYGLDWAPTLKAAKEKAAKEKRPILLLVVHNSYGNLYTGHC